MAKKVPRRGSEYQRGDQIVKTKPHMTTVADHATATQTESSKAATKSHIDKLGDSGSADDSPSLGPDSLVVDSAARCLNEDLLPKLFFPHGNDDVSAEWEAKDEAHWKEHGHDLERFVVAATGEHGYFAELHDAHRNFHKIEKMFRSLVHLSENFENEDAEETATIREACSMAQTMLAESDEFYFAQNNYEQVADEIGDAIARTQTDRLLAAGVLSYSHNEEPGIWRHNCDIADGYKNSDGSVNAEAIRDWFIENPTDPEALQAIQASQATQER